jgi:tRNA A-37 threonylcarbamoyl transferase component Bud32
MERIGKYQLRKVLGKGAAGTVYLALDTFSGAEVALKVLDPAVVASPDFEKTITTQFLSEASLAGKLSHPHIAAILEASVDESGGYIALEYVPGGDLSQYTKPGKLLTPQDGIQVAFKSCGALDYAFRQGIIHRDIKPANIMVVSGTNIKVADFGAAYLKTVESTHTTDIGSPYYMSPEQIEGAELGHHSDMFSMGVVLYELFTGQRPFTAATLDELFGKILRDGPPAPSTLRPELGHEIDRILLQMMAKRPGERYPTWADAALDIARAGRLSVYDQDVPDSDKFTWLRKVPMLAALGEAELWELVHAGQWRRARPRELVVAEGDPGTSLFFLAHGQAKVTKAGRLLNLLNAGECFGEMAYVKAGALPRQATVESMADSVLAEFEPQALEKTSLNCRLQLATALLHSMVDRLALANERMARAAQ